MLLPIPMLPWRAGLNKAHLIGLLFIFTLVFLTMALDVLRTVWYLSPNLAHNTDLVVLWVLLQPSIAVIICVLPTYGSLVPPGAQRRAPNSFRSNFVRLSDGDFGHKPLELGKVGNCDNV